MKLLQKKWLAAGVATIALGISSAQASTSASVTIDWKNLNVQYFDLSNGTNKPILTWFSQFGEGFSEAYTDAPYDYQSDYKSAPDFITSLSTLTSTSQAQSSSLRDGSFLSANSATQPGLDPVWLGKNYAQAYADNSGSFQLTGKGSAYITLDWHISLTGTAGDGSDFSEAKAYIYGYFNDGKWNSGSDYSAPIYNSFITGDFSTDGSFGFFVFSDGVNPAVGKLFAQSYVYSTSPVKPVPVPMAAWLFGSGLLGMAGIVRRKKAAA